MVGKVEKMLKNPEESRRISKNLKESQRISKNLGESLDEMTSLKIFRDFDGIL